MSKRRNQNRTRRRTKRSVKRRTKRSTKRRTKHHHRGGRGRKRSLCRRSKSRRRRRTKRRHRGGAALPPHQATGDAMDDQPARHHWYPPVVRASCMSQGCWMQICLRSQTFFLPQKQIAPINSSQYLE